MKSILTTANSNADILQDLNYAYDPVGNITQSIDLVQQTFYFNIAEIAPENNFIYDAIYRLISASGRQHIGQNTNATDDFDETRTKIAHQANWVVMRNYTQHYFYDQVGNILELVHVAVAGNYTRTYNYNSNNNILLNTQVGGATYSLAHDTNHGFINAMPHLSAMDYNFIDQLHHTTKGTTDTYYLYDSTGNRVAKISHKPGSITEYRYYIGSYELFRKKVGVDVKKEIESLSITDLQNKIVVLETQTDFETTGLVIGPTPVVPIPIPTEPLSPKKTLRYLYGNNLGNVALELDHDGAIISYEEYHPFGSTAYQAINTSIRAAAKRYRYNAKEQDEESGFYYYGARYYLPWLCRFSSVDPKALEFNWQSSYVYADNNPVVFIDFNGENGKKEGQKYDGNRPIIEKKVEPNTNTANLSERIKFLGAQGKDFGFASPSQIEMAKKSNGFAGDMKVYWNPNAVGLSGKKGDYFYQKQTSNDHITQKTPLEKITPISIKLVIIEKPEVVLKLTPQTNHNLQTKSTLPPHFKEGLGFEAPINNLDNGNTVPGRLSEDMKKYLDKSALSLKEFTNLESITINISINIGTNTTPKEYEFMRNVSVTKAFENMKAILQNRLDKKIPIWLNPEVGKSDSNMGKGTSFDYRLKK